MEKHRKLENNLDRKDEGSSPESGNRQRMKESWTKQSSVSDPEKPYDSPVKMVGRGFMALLLAFIFGGIFAGLIEAMTEQEFVTFGSFAFYLISVPQMIVVYALFYWIFTRFGPLKRQEFQNGNS